jgi:hypothetical protein
MTPVNAAGGTVNSSSADGHAPRRRDRPVGGPLLGRRHERRHDGAAAQRRRQGHRQLKVPGGVLPVDLRRRRRRPHLEPAGDALPRLPRRDRARHGGGSGAYSVADIQAGTGQDRFAGWALIVAYRDNAQPIRRLNVYDGLGTVDSGHTFSTASRPSTRRPPAR